MCTSKPKVPKVVERDPVAEQAAADNAAAAASNSETASRRKRLRASSLFTTGAKGTSSPPQYSAYAKASAPALPAFTSLGGTP